MYVGTPEATIEAKVLSVKLTGTEDSLVVGYEVSWWEGQTRNCVWVSELEVQKTKNQEIEIGFKK